MGVYRSSSISNICIPCLQAQKRRLLEEGSTSLRRSISCTSLLRQDGLAGNNNSQRTGPGPGPSNKEDREEGAMSRTLADLAEQAMTEGGRSARRNIQEAGFSEELKKQLEERVKESAFRSQQAAAFSIVNMPASAGKGTQDIAAASPWTGTESLHDATLRMLDDAKKPMRVPYKIPQPTPVSVNLKPTSLKPPKSTGHRLAAARDRTSAYALSQSAGLSEQEREALRKEMMGRFESGARPLPMTVQGLASLANERIEDAIASGKFKNLPRGKGVHVQTDHNANSAFIDTTEYFMNKIIQKQEIVPPWIEKQQELAKEVDRFRQRLRTEWRRHAARLIASQGGSLQQQIRRAQAYAAAEARVSKRTSSVETDNNNNNTRTEESFSQIDPDGRITLRPPPSPADATAETTADTNPQSSPALAPTTTEPDDTTLPSLPPLRDPSYMSIEHGYHALQIKTINELTRSYNLQAPRLAQKPYLNLERELNACYADVAPTLADEIAGRATEKKPPGWLGSSPPRKSSTGILDGLIAKERVRVYDEDRSKVYGLKELWRDLFGKKDEAEEEGRATS